MSEGQETPPPDDVPEMRSAGTKWRLRVPNPRSVVEFSKSRFFSFNKIIRIIRDGVVLYVLSQEDGISWEWDPMTRCLTCCEPGKFDNGRDNKGYENLYIHISVHMRVERHHTEIKSERPKPVTTLHTTLEEAVKMCDGVESTPELRNLVSSARAKYYLPYVSRNGKCFKESRSGLGFRFNLVKHVPVVTDSNVQY